MKKINVVDTRDILSKNNLMSYLFSQILNTMYILYNKKYHKFSFSFLLGW